MTTQMVSSTTTTVDHGGAIISTVHPDIIQTHILTRLDGPTLAATACASSQLHSLATQENLWRDICEATWPSVNDSRLRQLISTFPSGHRSFFSDAFPFVTSSPNYSKSPSPTATELISAVDVYYQNNLVYSKVQEVETTTNWFMCSPFRIDLLDPKESVRTPVRLGVGFGDASWLKHLEESLSLNWVLIDPSRKRAANISSRVAVCVQRHWLTGDVQVRYSTVLGRRKEMVECGIVVTCGGVEGGEMQVKEMSMVMEDMEGRGMSGKDSLVILEGAMESERRNRGDESGIEAKERYEEFVEKKKERKERQERKEKVLDMACLAVGITGFLGFWSAILLR